MSFSPNRRSRRRPHAQLHLPFMQPDQAALVVAILERVIKAIRRAHGQAMGDRCADAIDPPPVRTIRISLPMHDEDFVF